MQPGLENRPTEGKPWLKNEAWAARVLTYENNPGWPILIVAYLFFGGLSWLCVAGGLGLLDDSAIDWGKTFGGLTVASLLVWVLGGLTYWKIRHLRFGKSVCRLITLPGVIGGWFKADIECRLPLGAAPLIVRLRNLREGARSGPTVLWSLQKLANAPPPALHGSRHLIFPVRLLVPRHPLQVPDPLETPGIWARKTFWALEIEKKSSGVKFFASFRVPIYDVPNAPESEQQAE